MQKTTHINYLKVVENVPIYNEEIFQGNQLPPSKRLHDARIKAHMSIRELSAISGISTTTISAAEHGEPIKSPQILKKISDALKSSVWYLGHYENLPENTLGNKIYKARLFHGHYKNDLASLLKVDPHTISEWEQNKCIPEKQHMAALNKYLSILSK